MTADSKDKGPYSYRDLAGDAQAIIDVLRQNLPHLKRDYHVGNIQVFGSFLRNGRESANDLDLLVEFEKTPSLLGFIALENHLSDLLGIKVDLAMKDALKPTIGERILKEAFSP
ncbi:MAG: nucleotidyltransferase family protein [Actinobacteria bacterium]|nr:nucleotidyltransferase family protein [Actinomycetota bacterium]